MVLAALHTPHVSVKLATCCLPQAEMTQRSIGEQHSKGAARSGLASDLPQTVASYRASQVGRLYKFLGGIERVAEFVEFSEHSGREARGQLLVEAQAGGGQRAPRLAALGGAHVAGRCPAGNTPGLPRTVHFAHVLQR